jgi:hypothetical protein
MDALEYRLVLVGGLAAVVGQLLTDEPVKRDPARQTRLPVRAADIPPEDRVDPRRRWRRRDDKCLDGRPQSAR